MSHKIYDLAYMLHKIPVHRIANGHKRARLDALYKHHNVLTLKTATLSHDYMQSTSNLLCMCTECSVWYGYTTMAMIPTTNDACLVVSMYNHRYNTEPFRIISMVQSTMREVLCETGYAHACAPVCLKFSTALRVGSSA